ncbi:transmembrane protein 40 isoform X2 [Bufo bufo]|uniref:transmembrane protein 40 isoform X2 n=1 Tax=Bufo bufo TaxID=8384 RepID=UPI001ABDF163|nr:transmembrane protein 40 isoform X2 [Bufo bufo]
MKMSSEKLSLPNHTQEEQDIFQKAFTKDFENLKTNPVINPSFCCLYVTTCNMSSLSLYTDKEAQNIIQLSDPPGKQLALLKSVDDKGPQAVAIFYLLLHMNDERAYGELPSCKENDDKKLLLSKMRDKLSHVLQNKVTEMLHTTKPLLSHGFAKPAAQVAPMRPLKQKKEEKNASLNTNEKTDLEEKDINEDTSEKGKFDKNQGKSQRRSWGIKKDDEFFHFIIVCFALGAVLVCEYYYSDWTVSAGFGLISFATLETIGIYFGLVYRIRTVVEQFLPLVGRFMLGSKKTG